MQIDWREFCDEWRTVIRDFSVPVCQPRPPNYHHSSAVITVVQKIKICCTITAPQTRQLLSPWPSHRWIVWERLGLVDTVAAVLWQPVGMESGYGLEGLIYAVYMCMRERGVVYVWNWTHHTRFHLYKLHQTANSNDGEYYCGMVYSGVYHSRTVLLYGSSGLYGSVTSTPMIKYSPLFNKPFSPITKVKAAATRASPMTMITAIKNTTIVNQKIRGR